MKIFASLAACSPLLLPVLALIAGAGSASAQTLLFEDDFEDGVIDPNLWEIYSATGVSSAEETGGRLVLRNRAWLMSAAHLTGLDGDLMVEGEIFPQTVGGSLSDSWKVWLFANQSPGAFAENTDGLRASGFTGLGIRGEGNVVADDVGALPPGGSSFGFRVTTSGGVATWEVWNLADPSELVSCTTTYTKLDGAGERLILYNRERWAGFDYVLYLDNVRVCRVTTDCNGNGVPDDQDIASGASADCDGDGLPDECQIAEDPSLDCDGNGILDSCDLLAGTELDCNGNGIPDPCDVAAGTSLDCNGNGVPDECDIASGTSDCDGDGVPDACQITGDATLDLNANGVLDSCEAIGTNYCSPAIANSTGAPAAILALGSEVVASNDLTMTVSGLPPNTFAMFVTSQTQGYAFPVPGSQGALCVTGFPGRFNRPGQIQSSGSSGSLVFPVDLTSLPTPIGFTAAQPGDTWNFQAWYRDANPTVTSNFTDAVGITFQ